MKKESSTATLRPANVKITPAGAVKVLDFGLAKTAEAAMVTSASSPTMTVRATEAGIIMGAAAYMSPEQARGAIVDKRADIWAFGVVLYEMLAGPRRSSDCFAAVCGAIARSAWPTSPMCAWKSTKLWRVRHQNRQWLRRRLLGIAHCRGQWRRRLR
jgi:serine/threonine protein kinase